MKALMADALHCAGGVRFRVGRMHGSIGLVLVMLIFSGWSQRIVCGADHRTENFLVTAPTDALAVEIAESAERFRHDLAIEWLGHPLPRWAAPCPIKATVGQMGAGGMTSFRFEQGVPYDWRMSIQGSRERILDSVLPHEVTHTIFATHFGCPLPRWADEGACTSVEHPSEKARQEEMLIQFLKRDPPRSIPFNRMFRMTRYPRDLLPLYAQGHSVARYLIKHGGKRKFIDFVGQGMQTQDWDGTTSRFYGYRDLSELQLSWIAWVGKGSPDFGSEQGPSGALASRGQPQGMAPVALASTQAATSHMATTHMATSHMATPQSLIPHSPLAITSPLPPLLRPTDKEMQSVRNTMDRESFAALQKARAAHQAASSGDAPSADSWYAGRKRLSDDLPGDSSVRVASAGPDRSGSSASGASASGGLPAPRSLLPPARYTTDPATSSASLGWGNREGNGVGSSVHGASIHLRRPVGKPDALPPTGLRCDAPREGALLR